MTPKNSSNIQIINTHIHNYYLWLTLLIELKLHTHMAEYRVCSVYLLCVVSHHLGHNYWSQMLAAGDASSGLHHVPISVPSLSLSLCINHIISVNHGGHMLKFSFLIKSIYEMIYRYISNTQSSSCLWRALGQSETDVTYIGHLLLREREPETNTYTFTAARLHQRSNSCVM